MNAIKERYKVLLADDHSIFREGLKSMFELQDHLEVVGEVSDGKAAIEMCQNQSIDLVIMDLSMKGLDGLDATEVIVARGLPTKILVLSMHSHRSLVERAFKIGVSAFLAKEDAFNELARAIDAVLEGKNYTSSSLQMGSEEGDAYSDNKTAVSLSDLTEREIEVLKYLCDGWPNKAIAAHMDISVKTVEAHRSKLMRKLKIYSAAQLTKFAIREGLVSL